MLERNLLRLQANFSQVNPPSPLARVKAMLGPNGSVLAVAAAAVACVGVLALRARR